MIEIRITYSKQRGNTFWSRSIDLMPDTFLSCIDSPLLFNSINERATCLRSFSNRRRTVQVLKTSYFRYCISFGPVFNGYFFRGFQSFSLTQIPKNSTSLKRKKIFFQDKNIWCARNPSSTYLKFSCVLQPVWRKWVHRLKTHQNWSINPFKHRSSEHCRDP